MQISLFNRIVYEPTFLNQFIVYLLQNTNASTSHTTFVVRILKQASLAKHVLHTLPYEAHRNRQR